jgi:hypothetical protein
MHGFLRCPRCELEFGPHQYINGATSAAGIGHNGALVTRPQKKRVYNVITDRMRARARAGGLARAKQAGWTGRRHGKYLSKADVEANDREYFKWLYEKPGRAGGVERALFAKRDEFGQFAPDFTLTELATARARS